MLCRLHTGQEGEDAPVIRLLSDESVHLDVEVGLTANILYQGAAEVIRITQRIKLDLSQVLYLWIYGGILQMNDVT
jgi:hypothetical protein